MTDAERPELSKAFAGWLLGNTKPGGELASLASAAAEREGALQDFQTVAILGFGASAGILGGVQTSALKKGLRRQIGREVVIDEVPAAFCSDAVGILGVVLGTKAIADTELTSDVVKWLSKFLKNSYEGRCTEDWQRCLFAAADGQLGSPLKLSMPLSPACADARIALTAKGVIETGTGSPGDQDGERVLALTVRELPHELSCDQAALRLAAVEAIVQTVVPAVGRNVIHHAPEGRHALSDRDKRLRNAIGAERFRTLTNAEIMKEASPKKVLHAEGLDAGTDAAKSCLDRIRKAEGYPLSRDVVKKRSQPQ
ncbi:MAG: hypothetical protein JNL98_02140 [Bryobacterales bacterium]|nr:hypothetical protein [Bryobacterales bacterium]